MTPTDPASAPGRQKPDDGPSPPLAWRLVAEAVGTWLLTAVSVAPDVLGASLGVSLPDAVKAVTPGMTVALVIYAFGDVSGAHTNPAVRHCLRAPTRVPWTRVPACVPAHRWIRHALARKIQDRIATKRTSVETTFARVTTRV